MARVFPVVGAVISTVGCAQLAGIDNTSGSGRLGNSLELTRMSIGNQVVSTPLDLTGLQATYLLPGDTAEGFDRVSAKPSAQAGVWTQDLADPTPVEFTLPDTPTPLPRIFAFPSTGLKVLFALLEHPNRSPAPEGAMLTVNAMLDVASTVSDSFGVFTVGSWTSRAIVSGAVGLTAASLTYAFSTSTSLSGRAQLDRLTSQDAFLVLRHTSGGLTGVAEATPFDQSGTDTVVFPEKMQPVLQDQTLAVKISPPALAARYMAVRPGVGTLAMNWSLVAAPGYRIASNSGPTLQSGTLLATDLGLTVKYGNPFVGRGWQTIFTLQTSESRTTTPLGAGLPVTLSAGMNQFLEASLVSSGFDLTAPAGLPVLISIDGKQLSSDQMYAKPTKFAEVTFIADPVNCTVFNLEVHDLLPNAAATALEAHRVFNAASSEARFQVPPEVFQIGHYYTLRALCTYQGYPGIANGDFTNRQLPLAQSFLDSGVITVMP